MVAISDEEVLEGLDGDFRGLLDGKKVQKDLQVRLGRKKIDSVEMFAVLADSRDDFREALKTQLQLDPASDPTHLPEQAKLVVAWEAARQRMQSKGEKEAQAATEREPKSIPTNEFLNLKKQFEKTYYNLREEEIPSRNSLEDLAEQLETGDWRAMSLKEVASKADTESDSRWASMTVGKLGMVRLKKSSVETPAPKDLEEYRQKLKLLGHHYVFLKMLHPNRREIADVTPFTFLQLGDYMLSRRVAKLTSENDQGESVHTPSLKQVLTYDFYLRKKMVEEMSGETPLGESLKSAMECAVTKERYFTTPLAVSAATQASTRSRSPAPPATYQNQTKGKGQAGRKGRGKKGGRKGTYHSVTPEGRQICYAFNSASESCDGTCGRVHACQICFGPHGAHQHAAESKKTQPKPPDTGKGAATAS